MHAKPTTSKPELRNVGIMTRQQMDKLIATFPPGARIERTDILVTVKPPNIDTIVFSAAYLKSNKWHVRAMPGLIQTTVEQD